MELFEAPGSEDQLNLQFDGKISFDLGKLPHPFVQVFVNVAENDPVSNFQEIRPTVGVRLDDQASGDLRRLHHLSVS
ncbi:MAG: hypothetical protein KatS3mg104_0602 [Phycisphaerae bacterium]|nr:MAG: hypothetical protein KatS3mg104_0602 [Phycisphaerae bacterium]